MKDKKKRATGYGNVERIDVLDSYSRSQTEMFEDPVVNKNLEPA